jgi:hypothetical protein
MATTEEPVTLGGGLFHFPSFPKFPDFSLNPFGIGDRIESDNSYYKATLELYRYLSPVLLIGGLVGNLLSVVVAQQRAFRGSNFSLLILILIASYTFSLSVRSCVQSLVKLIALCLQNNKVHVNLILIILLC